MPKTQTQVLAQPFTARQCPVCQEWVYVDAGPFAEGDRTKTLADYNHWAARHATAEELSATSVGFPFFTYNDVPVQATFTR